MVFKRHRTPEQSDKGSTEPVSIGEAISEIVNVEDQEFTVDSQHESGRKLEVAERLADVLDQVRSDAIAELELPEDERTFTKQDMQDIQTEHLTAIADREELRQQLGQEDQPPDNPRP